MHICPVALSTAANHRKNQQIVQLHGNLNSKSHKVSVIEVTGFTEKKKIKDVDSNVMGTYEKTPLKL